MIKRSLHQSPDHSVPSAKLYVNMEKFINMEKIYKQRKFTRRCGDGGILLGNYCVIVGELVVSTLQSYTSMWMQSLVIQFKISNTFYASWQLPNLTHKFFSMYLFIYSSLHVSSTSCSSSGETNCINTASGNCHSVNK